MVQISQISAAMLCALHGMFAFAVGDTGSHFKSDNRLER